MSANSAFVKGPIDRGVTNIRNTSSPHWRRWLRPGFRCLMPATSFCEPTNGPSETGKKVWTWFALSDDRPLFAMAGIWTDWTGTRGTLKNPERGPNAMSPKLRFVEISIPAR
jgi:putative SOS response-associated peptidase YedK